MKRVLIIGAARSGLACAEYLLKKGADVILSDMNKALAKEVEASFADEKPTFIWGIQPDVAALHPDYIVMSPGVPLTIPPVTKARHLNIPVISEPELAYQESAATFIAITGTNGKTTTTTLTAYLLDGLAGHVLCAGNIGTPLIQGAPDLSENDLVVAELSSFQLEAIQSFRPHVAVFLNLTPDHLDRHKTMAEYGACKANIFRNQRTNDKLICNADDSKVVSLCEKAASKVYYFSQKDEPACGMWLSDGILYYRLHENDAAKVLMERKKVLLPGAHNMENVMASALVALLLGQEKEVVVERLMSFQGVAHRMEPVGCVDGVRYVNDSKGTNPDASIKALTSYDVPIVVILGGRNKGSDFTELAGVVKDHCRAAVVLGEAIADFERAFHAQDFINYEIATDFNDAVKRARDLAVSGDVVLLSPACASWDMFENYEVRGDTFKRLVNDFEKESYKESVE